MVHDLDRLLQTFRDKRPKELNILVFLMFDHIGGLNTLFNSLAMGTTMVLPESRDPDHVCSLIERCAINVLPASPTFLNLLLMGGAQTRHDLSSLKMVTYGTEPMPESLLQKLKASFPKVRFLQTFGTSETGIAPTASKSSSSTLLKIEDGPVQYKIVEKELWLRSRTQIIGYLNASMDSFTEDGWFKTGDLVEEAGDGYLRIVGRNKEVINVGGEKVMPSEVESVLLSMPEIVDCLVYGEASSIVGQIVVADVVVRPGVDAASLKKVMRGFCQGKLENYKIPVKVKVVDRTNFTARYKKVRGNAGAVPR
jgi:acyl-coenzyme A synthetase/AMP-(fatty) acid ligase